MHKALSNLVLVVMVLVAFVGQAMAYSVSIPCEFSAATYVAGDQTEAEVHEGENQIDTNCCDIECCDIDCICAANACSSVVYMNTNVSPTEATVITEPIVNWLSRQPNSISKLLYRPPIFTS